MTSNVSHKQELEIGSLEELVGVLGRIEQAEPAIASVRLVGKTALDSEQFKFALQSPVDHIIPV